MPAGEWTEESKEKGRGKDEWKGIARRKRADERSGDGWALGRRKERRKKG